MEKEKIIIIIDGYKFDVTDYVEIHPGGSKILRKFNGKDCTKEFDLVKGHGDSNVFGLLDDFCIGKVDS